MNRDDIIRMAREAGAISYTPPPLRAVRGVSLTFEQLDEFAALVAAAEREACAKVCESLAEVEIMPGFTASTRTDQFECAAAIRARGQQ